MIFIVFASPTSVFLVGAVAVEPVVVPDPAAAATAADSEYHQSSAEWLPE
jgi:hypothetical protein